MSCSPYLSIWTPDRAGPPRFGPSVATAIGSACRGRAAARCVGSATARINGNRRRTGYPRGAAPAIFPIPRRHCAAGRSSYCYSVCCASTKEKAEARMRERKRKRARATLRGGSWGKISCIIALSSECIFGWLFAKPHLGMGNNIIACVLILFFYC